MSFEKDFPMLSEQHKRRRRIQVEKIISDCDEYLLNSYTDRELENFIRGIKLCFENGDY